MRRRAEQEHIPQYWRQDEPPLPCDITELTSRLRDQDHHDLGELVVAQYLQFERLKAYCELLTVEVEA